MLVDNNLMLRPKNNQDHFLWSQEPLLRWLQQRYSLQSDIT